MAVSQLVVGRHGIDILASLIWCEQSQTGGGKTLADTRLSRCCEASCGRRPRGRLASIMHMQSFFLERSVWAKWFVYFDLRQKFRCIIMHVMHNGDWSSALADRGPETS